MARTSLDDILVFTAVVDKASFAGGGESLGMSRSAAGKAVKRLEERLGRRLLNRTTRSITLTNEGRLLYEHGRQILASVDEAERSVAGTDAAPRGTLRLTVPSSFARLVVMPVLGRYLEAYPNVQVEMSFSDRLADIVDEGFDLAIRIGVTAADTQMVTRVVSRRKVMLCAAPGYLAAKGNPAAIEDLAGHDGLLFASRSKRHGWQLEDHDGNIVRARIRSRLRLDSGEALRDAALAGLGIALLPDFLLADDIADGRLVEILPGVDAGTVNIVALYPTKRLLEPRVRRFIDLIIEALER